MTAEDTSDLLHLALGQGFDLVLANKKPLAGSAQSYERLLAAAAAAGRRIRYEATVGAGLPIIDTHLKLVESGDRVLRIDGCVSGTLGYVLSSVSEGSRSQAVLEVVDLGHAEPDPREDPAATRFARGSSWPACSIPGRSSLPKTSCLGPAPVPLPEFLKRLPSLDATGRREWHGRRPGPCAAVRRVGHRQGESAPSCPRFRQSSLTGALRARATSSRSRPALSGGAFVTGPAPARRSLRPAS